MSWKLNEQAVPLMIPSTFSERMKPIINCIGGQKNGDYLTGSYSTAAISVVPLTEVKIEVISKGEATYIGIYDSDGLESSWYFEKNLFNNLMNIPGTDLVQVLKEGFRKTDDMWKDCVRKVLPTNKMFASCGTYCLVGLVIGDGESDGEIYAANSGTARAICDSALNDFSGTSFTVADKDLMPWFITEDNIDNSTVLDKVMMETAGDPDFIVVDEKGKVTIKGQTKIYKSLGHLYLKEPEFNIDHLPEYRLDSPLVGKIGVKADPTTAFMTIKKEDQFMIFATSRYWDVITVKEATATVKMSLLTSRKGIAATLLRLALTSLAKERGKEYKDLQKMTNVEMMKFHKNMGVVVLLLHPAGGAGAGGAGPSC